MYQTKSIFYRLKSLIRPLLDSTCIQPNAIRFLSVRDCFYENSNFAVFMLIFNKILAIISYGHLIIRLRDTPLSQCLLLTRILLLS